MLKKLGLLFIFFTLFFLSTQIVIAQTPTKVPKKIKLPIKQLAGDQEIPGLTCGDGTDETIDQCCVIKDINTKIEIKDPEFFCLPFDGPCASEIPLEAFDGFIRSSSFPKQIEDLAKLTKKGEGCLIGKAETVAGKCKCKASALTTLCTRYVSNTNPTESAACNRCVANGDAIWTGLGCIKITPAGFVTSIMGIGVGLAGGIAFLCILYAAILMQTSAGNPERLKKAREYLTACIAGLLLILFSVFILRIIGVDILGVPFFS